MDNKNEESNSEISTKNQIYIDESSCGQSSSPADNLIINWKHQIDILQHMFKKAREMFLNSDKVNEFPECNWFEEDDLLFEDTMTECAANVNDQYANADIKKLEETISESVTELNDIVARLTSLTE